MLWSRTLLGLLVLLATAAAALPAPAPSAHPSFVPVQSAIAPTAPTSAAALLQPLAGAALNVSVHMSLNFSVSVGYHPAPSNSSAGNSTAPPPVPCSDPRGCPDLLVDASKLVTAGVTPEKLAASNCNVVEGSTQAGARRLLRFTFTTPNFGDGDLIIGDPALHPEWFEWGLCHSHWHFREYAAYRLWTVPGYLQWQTARSQDPNATADQVLAAHPELQSAYLAGHKQGFCAKDVVWYVIALPGHYGSCDEQGISVGWADEYNAYLDGQFVDVTGVPPGPYVLEAEVNPHHFYIEKSYSNNSGALVLVLPPPLG
ncbi:MAG TPA: lysyl oxidase family protein [Candidatus Thermoplasmatota archaeon]|nr:lysyl oxidase family protein [Candidatus Thermoplasmatota archaeon]